MTSIITVAGDNVAAAVLAPGPHPPDESEKQIAGLLHGQGLIA